MSYRDFIEFIRTLNQHRVRFVVIGGYAIAFHGNPRATDDIDVLIDKSETNVRRVERALFAFAGVAPSARALRKKNGMVRIGGALVHIDITTKIQGIAAFETVWNRRVRGDLLGEKTAFMSVQDLLRTKRAANGAKDQGDIAFLETLARSPKYRGG